jgi:hypothetical protein
MSMASGWSVVPFTPDRGIVPETVIVAAFTLVQARARSSDLPLFTQQRGDGERKGLLYYLLFIV